MYTEYLAAKTENESEEPQQEEERPGFGKKGSDQYDDDISDESKISLMRDAFRI